MQTLGIVNHFNVSHYGELNSGISFFSSNTLHLIHTVTPRDSHCHYPHFVDEETGPQRG